MKPGSHILIVDDDGFFRDLLRDVFSEQGFTISEAVDGQEALRILETTKADLAIIDLEMPRMNGLDLAREMKSKYPGFPIVMITAYAEAQMPSDILSTGVDAFLQKPVPVDKLVKVIMQM
jgi:two-component system OmpR family response regulator